MLGTCEVPSFPLAGSTDGGYFNDNTQYIIPTMNFTGYGVITNWTIEGAGGGGPGRRKRIIELQLFRPDPTQSTVFTKVTSSVVTTTARNNELSTHTFKSIGFTFSPGDVLGFYYPNHMGGFLVRHTNSFSTHSVLTSRNSPTASVVTLTATVTSVPLMSVSGELSHLMLVHSVLYSHHCVCGYLLCAVSCTETNTDGSGPGAPIAAVVVVVLLFIIILTVLIVITIVAIVLKKKDLEQRFFPSGNTSHPVSSEFRVTIYGQVTGVGRIVGFLCTYVLVYMHSKYIHTLLYV